MVRTPVKSEPSTQKGRVGKVVGVFVKGTESSQRAWFRNESNPDALKKIFGITLGPPSDRNQWACQCKTQWGTVLV